MRRVDHLVADGSLSQRERDQTVAALRQAEAAVRQGDAAVAQTRASHAAAEQDLNAVAVNRQALEGTVEAARAAVRLAEFDLEHTVVRAPREGRVGEVGVKLGQYVTPGTQLMAVVPSQVWVIANFKERQTAHMAAGQSATLRVDALADATLTGRIERISPATGRSSASSSPTTRPATSPRCRSACSFGSRSTRGSRSPSDCDPACLSSLPSTPLPRLAPRRRCHELAAGVRWRGVVACACAFLGGCGTPRTAPPLAAVADPPASWRRAGGEAELEARWWRGFGDPVLASLVERALERNTDLRTAMARVAEARAAAQAEHGAELPRLDFGAGGERAKAVSDVTLRPYHFTGWKAAFEASYEVDLRGRLAALSEAADATLVASRAARDTTALAVASATAAAYINLIALDERLLLARRTLEARHGALEVARSRQQSGHTSAFELAQAQAEYKLDSRGHPAARARGRAPGARARRLARRNAKRGHSRIRLVGARGAAVARARCSVLAASAPARHRGGRVAGRCERRAARGRAAQMLPALQLSAGLGRVGSSVFRGDPFSIWTLGASVLAPIFNGGQLQAQADVAGSRRDQAILAYRKTVVNAFVEVEDQLAALEHLQEQSRQAEEQRSAVAEALRIARNRYREGYASYLEELDAQRTLFGRSRRWRSCGADLLTAHVNLYRALGGGWASEL
jgi:outer membrane protein TolC/biotin carboxyl carrier protein